MRTLRKLRRLRVSSFATYPVAKLIAMEASNASTRRLPNETVAGSSVMEAGLILYEFCDIKQYSSIKITKDTINIVRMEEGKFGHNAVDTESNGDRKQKAEAKGDKADKRELCRPIVTSVLPV